MKNDLLLVNGFGCFLLVIWTVLLVPFVSWAKLNVSISSLTCWSLSLRLFICWNAHGFDMQCLVIVVVICFRLLSAFDAGRLFVVCFSTSFAKAESIWCSILSTTESLYTFGGFDEEMRLKLVSLVIISEYRLSFLLGFGFDDLFRPLPGVLTDSWMRDRDIIERLLLGAPSFAATTPSDDSNRSEYLLV